MIEGQQAAKYVTLFKDRGLGLSLFVMIQSRSSSGRELPHSHQGSSANEVGIGYLPHFLGRSGILFFIVVMDITDRYA